VARGVCKIKWAGTLNGRLVRFKQTNETLAIDLDAIVVIGNRLKELRESKELSQGDIEKRTGLLRCYISRVENGHTVPAIETQEKMARALELPMYRLFHDGEVPAGLNKMKPPKDHEFGSKGREADYFSKLRRLLAKMEPDDQKLLLHMAQKVARD
jgi:transcriptional regulator with XRE-family HTH domain